MVEGARLEIVYPAISGILGSNPSLSARITTHGMEERRTKIERQIIGGYVAH